MNSESIYAILASKPHNPHYLKRYYKFIQWCQKNPSTNEFVERHHICPKASDLFPEYENFIKNPWNGVILSVKQHIIAHILLWKSYGGSQSIAVHHFLNVQGDFTNGDYHTRKIPTSIQIRYAAKARIEFIEWRRGKSTFKDSEGNKFFLEVDDPKIKELCLVGNNTGHTHSDETREKQSYAKFLNSKVTFHFLNNTVKVPRFSDEYDAYIAQGWTQEYLQDDIDYSISIGNAKNSEFWTNRMRYMSQDGVYHGSYLKDDPIIQKLNLVPLRTQSQIEQNASRTELATKARTGSNIYNNGIEEKFLFEPIDETWILGRLPYSEEGRNNQINGTREACSGAKTYNNGKTNIFIKEGESIPEGFKLGMKCRPNTTYWYIKNDRSDATSFVGQHNAPDGYFFSNERDAGVVLRLKRESEMIVVDKESAKELVEYCMYNGKFNNNRNELFNRHKSTICKMFEISDTLRNSTIVEYVLNGTELKKCRCCDVHIEKTMTYCSISCGSKMKYK